MHNHTRCFLFFFCFRSQSYALADIVKWVKSQLGEAGTATQCPGSLPFQRALPHANCHPRGNANPKGVWQNGLGERGATNIGIDPLHTNIALLGDIAPEAKTRWLLFTQPLFQVKLLVFAQLAAAQNESSLGSTAMMNLPNLTLTVCTHKREHICALSAVYAS